MNTPLVSIVMVSYKRPAQTRNTLRSIFSQRFKDYEVIVVDDGPDDETGRFCIGKVRYIPLQRPKVLHRNASLPLNTGLREARGDIIILQNSECFHVSRELIKTFVDSLSTNSVVFASAKNEHRYGTDAEWYCHPKHRPVPFFFCGALRRELVCRLGGFDENFEGYGCEDNDFAERLSRRTKKILWLPPSIALVRHQWHEQTGGTIEKSEAYLKWKQSQQDYPDNIPWLYSAGISVADSSVRG